MTTGLVQATDTLRKLILENPELPLVVFAGRDACDSDYSLSACSKVDASIGEFLDCVQDIDEERVFDDRDDFEDILRERYAYDFDGTDDEFEEFIEKKLMEYEPDWTKCIILYVDN